MHSPCILGQATPHLVLYAKMLVPMPMGQLPGQHLAHGRCTVNNKQHCPSFPLGKVVTPTSLQSSPNQRRQGGRCLCLLISQPTSAQEVTTETPSMGSLFFPKALLASGEGQLQGIKLLGVGYPEDVLSPSVRSPQTCSTEPSAGFRVLIYRKVTKPSELGRLTSF